MKVTREAGLNERRCIVRDVSGYYGTIITIAKHWSREIIDTDSWIKQIKTALTAVIEQHPALRASITASRTEHPLVVTAAEVNVSQHIKKLALDIDIKNAEDILQQLILRVHAYPFDGYEERPQWRVYVLASKDLQSIYIAFAASHALTDGMSGMIFHQSLLHHMRTIERESDTQNDTTLPPSIEEAGKLSISPGFLLRPLLNEFLPPFITRLLGVAPPSHAWTGSSTRPALPEAEQLVETKVIVKLISPQTLNKLLQECRQRDCRLTSLLNFVVAKSLAEALKKRQVEYLQYVAEVPYDLRRCLPQWKASMANYASSIDLLIELDGEVNDQNLSEQEWKRIRLDTAKLQKASSTLADQTVGLLKYISNIEEWVKKRASQSTSVSFSTSNLGSLSIGETADASYKIEEFVFSQSADATGAPFNLNVASSRSGPLAIVMTWLPSMLGTEEAISNDEMSFAQEICQSVCLRLESIAINTSHTQAS